ncbi:hypothetical protein [Aeoliella sp.]|uniref:hypothetical protein n=1 Tax=Aeoliella sp. TaxID=2795800 RepID=UPI003CCBD309
MRQLSALKVEMPDDAVVHPRTLRFTTADLFTLVSAIPVCIGVVAAVEFTAFEQSYEWFGIDWYSGVRHFLMDSVGVPPGFVARYVTFAMADMPAWFCYSIIAIALGLIRSKWALVVGTAFILSIFIWDLMSDCFSGLHAQTNLRIVSLFGVALAAACFAITRRIRGRSLVSDHKTGRSAMGITCLAIVLTLAVSMYGWWLVGLTRQAGLEVQEMFNDVMP